MFFLTATPRNKSAWDIYHQIKLFHQDDKTNIPIDSPNIREYFKLVEKGERNLPDLLNKILIRHTQKHVLRWYGFYAPTPQSVYESKIYEHISGNKRAYILVGGRHQFFPRRELETITYSIEDTYQGLYQEIRGYLGKRNLDSFGEAPKELLTYARYGL